MKIFLRWVWNYGSSVVFLAWLFSVSIRAWKASQWTMLSVSIFAAMLMVLNMLESFTCNTYRETVDVYRKVAKEQQGMIKSLTEVAKQYRAWYLAELPSEVREKFEKQDKVIH